LSHQFFNCPEKPRTVMVPTFLLEYLLTLYAITAFPISLMVDSTSCSDLSSMLQP